LNLLREKSIYIFSNNFEKKNENKGEDSCQIRLLLQTECQLDVN
jgi:hypothetical protein